VCVLQRGDELLLIPGYDRVRDIGFFIPPGGGIEFGEHSSTAVIREVMEEFGVRVEAPRLLGVFENIRVVNSARRGSLPCQ
jgi:ADP-ribose pyrophosphatase YjhB (NUDIX family)